MTTDKKPLNEQEIRTRYITPAIEQAGWDIHTQVRENEVITQGRVEARGNPVKRGKRKEADYVLYHKPGIPLAVVEAKDNKHGVGDGMQQALDYGEMWDVSFVYSTNGDAFLEHDKTVRTGHPERELAMDSFPSPAELWERYCAHKHIRPEHESVVASDYCPDSSGKKSPRYYQKIAINRAVEVIAKGANRILLVMATGTGKTYVAFQILWRLWKSREWKPGKNKRILFLADRNILVDQTRVNDFRPFKDVMTKIKDREIDPAYEVYLALYQAITGPEEEQKIYKNLSPDFFDLIVVDECHRGSAKDDSAWREILEYFAPATQIGMTATPKETKYTSNINYFGEPVYTYSLKQGIVDGFLAPYRVIRIDFDKDQSWRPFPGQRDKHGVLIDNREYNQLDMDGVLVLEERTKLVAQRITEFLKATDRFAKTIVFCESIEHAERMRQALVNENADLVKENRKYIMRITGDEEAGKAELDNFINPERTHPVIATTSKLLSTGVDVQTCKLIVLDQHIQSISMFKQIIGRGTRINEGYGKMYFTIMDFKNATRLFFEPDFDGEPETIYEVPPGGPVFPPGTEPAPGPGDMPPSPQPIKYYVDDVPVSVVAERILYQDSGGKLVTDSLRDYTRKQVLKEYSSLDSFIKSWSDAEQKAAIVHELCERGIFLEELERVVGDEYDPFDLVCHVAFDQPPLTRRERADNVRKRNYFAKYGDNARKVLEALLDKYADTGVGDIEDMEVLLVQPINEFGTAMEILGFFGGREAYQKALRELESLIYSAQAKGQAT